MLCIDVYIYIYMYTYIYRERDIHVYIYIYRERERERYREYLIQIMYITCVFYYDYVAEDAKTAAGQTEARHASRQRR